MQGGVLMTKSIILMILAAFLVSGCAEKKQIVKAVPEQQEVTPPPPPPATKEEAPVRFNDWTAVPQIETVHFDFDKAELGEADRAILQKNAEYLKSESDKMALVEGHCDERGTIEYNLALGQKRAAAVREYYGKLGVPLGSIATISYGNEKPVDTAHNEAAWAKNRRAETKLRSK
jgi:peptidoglycan-associated lipoprotein